MSYFTRNQQPQMSSQQAAHKIAERISDFFRSFEGKETNIHHLMDNSKYIDITHANPAQATGLALANVTHRTVFLCPNCEAPHITRESLASDPKSTLEFILAHIGCSSDSCNTDHVNFVVSELYRIFGQPQHSDAGKRHTQILTSQQVLEKLARNVASYYDSFGSKGLGYSNMQRLNAGEKYIDITHADPYQGTGFAIQDITSKTVLLYPDMTSPNISKEMLASNPKLALTFILAHVGYSEFKISVNQIDALVTEFERLYAL